MPYKRFLSGLLSVAMVASLLTVPASAAEDQAYIAEEEVSLPVSQTEKAASPSVEIISEEVTPQSETLAVFLSNLPSLGILRVIELNAGEDYNPAQLNNYTSLCFASFFSGELTEGENVLFLSAAPTAGKQLLAVIRDSSGDVTDYPSDPIIVTAVTETPAKSWQEVLANCSITLLEDGSPRTAPFRQEATTVDYVVKLDDSLSGCRLIFYVYPGNTSFDPDSGYTKRLGGLDVADGSTGQFSLDLTAVPVGYKVIAGLYICLDGDDFYQTKSSLQTLEVVDENGEGFQDYIYPNATIDETTLHAGDTSLHISLSGDERLFRAAAEGKVHITAAVSQYPDGESFDFEGAGQISLVRNLSVTEAFSGREVTLEEPLRPGYRVRAVVYWDQNVELFLPKGNDYESVFGLPDDSVLVSSPAAAGLPDTIPDDAVSIPVALLGELPQGTGLLLKQFAVDEDVVYDKGAVIGSAWNITSGTVNITPSSALIAGQQVVAFLLLGGEPIAQSAPAQVGTLPDFSIVFSDAITTETRQVTFAVSAKAGLEQTTLNLVGLCRVDEYGRTDITNEASYVARSFGQSPGEITLTGISGLTAGERVRFVLRYFDRDGAMVTLESTDITVITPLAENSILIHETSFTADSTAVTVTVSGCDFYLGDMLRLTTGAPSTDNYADGRTWLTGQAFTGAGTYTFPLDGASLTGGNTIQAYLYHYDATEDRTFYQYSNSVTIETSAVDPELPTQAETAIVTQNVTPETDAVYVTASFDGSALLALYAYTGEDSGFLPEAPNDYVGIKYLAEAPSASQKVELNRAMTEGEQLVAVLYAGGITGEIIACSAPVTVEAAPEREAPIAYIRDEVITAGLTRINVAMSCDSRTEEGRYTLYQFTGETLDRETATVITSGTLGRTGATSIYVGVGYLQAGSKLQLLVSADGAEALSNIVPVLPSPDWGTPYVAFGESAVKTDAETLTVSVDYADEYLSLGDDFYCDVTVYTFPANYTDQQVEDLELWENFSLCTSVAKVNSRLGDKTRGQLIIPIREGAALAAGDRLFIKLRLPHVEWEGEEVDYVSASIPIIGADESVAQPVVLLYNLGEETSLGLRLRTVLAGLGISARNVADSQLNEKVGYLAGREGYEPSEEPYTGEGADVQFMLMANFPEALLDRFLASMTENGISIGHKAVTTDYNVEYAFHELIDDIAEEHQTFQALLELDKLLTTAASLSEDVYGASEGWNALQEAIQAGGEILAAYEPELEDLQAAIDTLKAAYLAVSGLTELTGELIITSTEQADGLYTLTASMNNGEHSEYHFTWNSGETGPVLTGIPAEKLIACRVTVTADGALGSLTAQLAVPDAPEAVLTTSSTTLTVTVTPPAGKANCPAPLFYRAALYQEENLVAEETFSGNSLTFRNLTAASEYCVKLSAVSVVGISDQAVFSARTAASESGRTPSASSSSEVNITESDVPLTELPMLFEDVAETDWYYDAVYYVFSSGLMKGVSDTAFRPADKGTRGMIAAILWTLEGEPEAEAVAFADVSADTWYTRAIAWAAENAIMTGDDTGCFGPKDIATREQFITMLFRYAEYLELTLTADGELGSFRDGQDVSAWAVEAMRWAVGAGIIEGKEDGKLDPQGKISRAELAAIFQRMATLLSADAAD